MSDSIDKIARLVDLPEVQVLSFEAARSLLLHKSKPETSTTIKHAIQLEAALKGFAMGSNNIGEVRNHAENLVEAADDDLSLIYAILETPERDRGEYDDHEIAPLGSIKFVDAVHNIMELSRGYLSGRCKGEDLCEAALAVSQLCYNAYRNAVIVETHQGSGFYLEHNFNPRLVTIEVFNKTLVETVSSGAIGAGVNVALRPAIIGSKKRPTDIFSKKKNRWYLKYAIE